MFKLFKENKDKIFTGIIIGIGIVSFYMFLNKLPAVTNFLKLIFAIITPFILGYGIAFLALPIRKKIIKLFDNSKLSKRFIKNLAATGSFLVIVSVIVLFFAALIPQIITSIDDLTKYVPTLLEKINVFVASISERFPQIKEYISDFTNQDFYNLLSNFQTYLTKWLPSIFGFSLSLLYGIFNVFVAFVVAFYVLKDKEHLDIQFRRLNYYLFKNKGDFVLSCVKVFSDKFNGFLIGKSIDSIIIGLLCFVGMKIFQFPYPILISTIIGISNMIPVFGPFIGAVPGVIIILIINPIQALWFCLFVLVLQQLDGNIIGPFILKDSMKLPLFWVMFAIVVGGGLYGVFGMLLGLPIFSSCYTIFGHLMDKKIKKSDVVDIEVKSI
ncbi:MAG: AI-2E family transporter [Erysipelotrichaceae bacterium]